MTSSKLLMPGVLRSLFGQLIVLQMCLNLLGCAQETFVPHPNRQLPHMTREQLLSDCWLVPGHRYLCRHSGLLEVFTRDIPLEGVIKIDTDRSEARLIAMDSMGVKLFDLSVSSADYQLNYLLPLLSEHKQLPEMVAKSVQHIFLQPYPETSGELKRSELKYQIIDDASGVSFDFVGVPLRLSTKAKKSTEDKWQVDYYQYKKFTSTRQSLWAPSGIILDDGSGFRLTLWIQELREL